MKWTGFVFDFQICVLLVECRSNCELNCQRSVYQNACLYECEHDKSKTQHGRDKNGPYTKIVPNL